MDRKFKNLALISLIIFFTAFAAAEITIDTQDSPDVVWENQDNQEVDFTVEFSGCSEEEVIVEDAEGDEVESFEISEDDEYSFDNWDETGEYTVVASCEEDEEDFEETATLSTFDSINLDITGLESLEDDVEDTFYVGDEIKLDFEKSSEEGNDLPDNSLELIFDSSGLSSEKVEDNDETYYEVELPDPEALEMPSDEFYREVEASLVLEDEESLDVEVEDTMDFDVEREWQIEEDSFEVQVDGSRTPNEVRYEDMEDAAFRFVLLKRGDTFEDDEELREDQFQFISDRVDNEDGNRWLNREYEGSGEYLIEIDDRPVINDPGYVEADFELFLLRENDVFIGEMPVEKAFEFKGNVEDRAGRSVSASLTGFYNGASDSDETDDGEFSIDIPDTEADLMEFSLPGSYIELEDFQLSNNVDDEDETTIFYHYYDDPTEYIDSSELPTGVRPVNLMGVRINHNFDDEDSRGQMDYDTSDVSNPSDVQLYECSFWDSERCVGEWEELEDTDSVFFEPATPPNWRARFPIEPLESDRFPETDQNFLSNAYLVAVPQGEGESLTLEEPISFVSDELEEGSDVSDSLRVKGEGSFESEGTVISEDTGNYVPEADVTMAFDGPETSEFEAEAGDDGSFGIEGDLPEEPGSYDINVGVEKVPFDSFEDSWSSGLEIFYERGLSVTTDSPTEIEFGETEEINIEVENIGDRTAEDIEVTVSGLDESKFTLDQTSIDSLDSDSSESLTLSLTISEDELDPGETLGIDIDASGTSDGEGVEGTSSIRTSMEFDREEAAQSSDDGSSDDSDESSSESEPLFEMPEFDGDVQAATGEFIESQSDMNLALGLILVFAMILAVAVKQKDENGSDRNMRGRGQSRVQQPNVAPTKVNEPNSETGFEKDDKEEDVEASNDEDETESSEESENNDSDTVKCDVCGEKFDTESGMNLHKQALH